MSDVALRNAHAYREKLADVLSVYSLKVDPEVTLKEFAFMNFVLAFGVWCGLRNKRLRWDLQDEFKCHLTSKLATVLTNSPAYTEVAARAVFLQAELAAYLQQCISRMKRMDQFDSGVARLCTFERLQKELRISDSVMNDIVPVLLGNNVMHTEVETVALQIVRAAEASKPKGLLRRLIAKLGLLS